MFFREWEVLLVDDEPDVLQVSKLAMKNFEVYALPLKIHTAKNKAEALEFLGSRPDVHLALAVAFIDVVMETDSAGLDLCQHIRENMNNKLTQLFIRTGQPGIAPERAVIDRYDINGYFTKNEATEDKLYSLVKSGVRQYLWARTAQLTIATFDQIMTALGSQDKLLENMKEIGRTAATAVGRTSAPESEQLPTALWIGDKTVILKGWAVEEAKAVREQLDQLTGTPLNGGGDKYVKDDTNHQFIKVAAQSGKPAVYWQFNTAFEPPIEIIDMFYRAAKGFNTVLS